MALGASSPLVATTASCVDYAAGAAVKGQQMVSPMVPYVVRFEMVSPHLRQRCHWLRNGFALGWAM